MAVTQQGALTVKLTAAADVFTPGTKVGSLPIRGITWVGGTTAGHEVIVHDGDGKIIWQSVATAANFKDEIMLGDGERPYWAKGGIVIDTLGSGVVLLHLL